MRATFSNGSRGRQARRAGGQEATGATRHRAKHARIGGSAQAHLAPRPRVREHAVAGAVLWMRAACTATEITLNAASSTVSEVPTDLPMGRDEHLSTQHTRTQVVQAGLLVRLPPEKWHGILSASTGQCHHGAAYLFGQSRRARWRRMNGRRPVRGSRNVSAHGGHEVENQPRMRPGIALQKCGVSKKVTRTYSTIPCLRNRLIEI